MILYVLDSSYRPVDLIDTYESLIWTERFDKLGDFELVVPADSYSRARLTMGTLLHVEESKRIMVIDTIQDTKDDTGKILVRYTGPSFEGIFGIRVGHNDYVGSIKALMNQATKNTLIDGGQDILDVVPGLNMGTNVLYPTSTIDPPVSPTKKELAGWSNLARIHDSGSEDQPLGYRIVRDNVRKTSEWRPDYTSRPYVHPPTTSYDAFPTVVEDHNGRLVVAWGSSVEHVGIGRSTTAFSTDDFLTWNNGPIIESEGLIQLVRVDSRPGVLVALMRRMVGSSTSWFRTSTNNGDSWGSATQIPNFGGSATWMFPNDLIWIDQGNTHGLLIGTGYNDKGVPVFSSTDGGANWTQRSMLSTLPWNNGPNECNLLHLGGNTIMAAGRWEHNVPFRKTGFCMSYDMGVTWSDWDWPAELQNTQVRPKISMMSDGTIMLPLRDTSPHRPDSMWAHPAAWSYAYLPPGETEWQRREMDHLGDEMMMYGEFISIGENRALLIGSSQQMGSSTMSNVWAMRFDTPGELHRLYYDNYTGNDKSQNDVYEIMPNDTQLFDNPYFREVDRDVLVWKNLCANPGFTNGNSILSSQHYKEMGTSEMEMGGAKVSVVDADWTTSGKALELVGVGVEEGATSYNTTAKVTWLWSAIEDSFEGKPIWGKTFTFRCRVRIPKTIGGTTVENPPTKMSLYMVEATQAAPNTMVATSSSAGTAPGIHDISLTYTFPAKGNAQNYNRWNLRLDLGSWQLEATCEFGDFIIMEHPSMPRELEYFDGSYSPDMDLTPVWVGAEWASESILTGRVPQGVLDTVNCVAVQSVARDWEPSWAPDPRITMRLINNTGIMDGQVVVKLRDKAKHIRARVIVPWVTSGANSSNFARVMLGDQTSAAVPNTAPTDVERTVSFPNGSNMVRFKTGFTELGASVHFYRLVAGESSSTTGAYEMSKSVIFSESLDNFAVSKVLNSTVANRNVSYVSNNKDFLQLNRASNNTLFGRRVVLVDGDDVNESNPSRDSLLYFRAHSELMKSSPEVVIDGEVTPTSRYIYDVDYSLGDIVVVEDFYGRRQAMRVMEQIFISDENGYRTYPTMVLDNTSVGGEWKSIEYNIPWASSESFGTWSDQP